MSDGSARPTVTIKLRHGGKLRRVRISAPVDKQSIYAVVRDSNYPEYRDLPDPENMELFELCFQDDEGDRVNLSDPRDFADAVSFFDGQGKIPSFLVDIRKRERVTVPSEEIQLAPEPLAGEQQQQGRVEGAHMRPEGGFSTRHGHSAGTNGAGNPGSANLLDPASPLPSSLSLLTSDLASANGSSSFLPGAFGPAGAFSIGVGTVAGRGAGAQVDSGRGSNLLGSVDIGNILGEDLGDLIRGDAPPGLFGDGDPRKIHSAHDPVTSDSGRKEHTMDEQLSSRWPDNSMDRQSAPTRVGTLAPDSSEFIPPFSSSALPSRVYGDDAPPFEPGRRAIHQSESFDPQKQRPHYETQGDQQYLYQQHYSQFSDRQDSSYPGNFQDMHYQPQSRQFSYFDSAAADESGGLQTGQLLARQQPAATQVDTDSAPPGFGQISRQPQGGDKEHGLSHGGTTESYPADYAPPHTSNTGG